MREKCGCRCCCKCEYCNPQPSTGNVTHIGVVTKNPFNGLLETEDITYWYRGDTTNLHRTDGPAFVRFNRDKNSLSEHYYLNGKEIDEHYFNERLGYICKCAGCKSAERDRLHRRNRSGPYSQ